jgi:outer membrane receptor protein involved in Fe transport
MDVAHFPGDTMKNNTRNPFTFKKLTLCSLLAVTPGLTLAQATLQEIVVTARKSDESLQTTPVAVTAMTEAMLVDQGILKMDDLQRTAPSLTIGTGGTGPASIIYTAIRGQAQNSPNSSSMWARLKCCAAPRAPCSAATPPVAH